MPKKLGQFLMRKQAEVGTESDPSRRIHLARAQSKRLMALLTLFRGSLKTSEFRAQKLRIKNAADLLADDRDRHVIRICISDLAEDLTKADSCRVAAWVEANLPESDQADATRRFEISRTKLSEALGSWSFGDSHGFGESFEAGIKKLQCKAKKAYQRAKKQCSFKTMHAFRKTVKTLVLNFECAAAANLKLDRDLNDKLDRLQKNLGKINDLAVTKDFLKNAGGFDAKTCRKVLRFIKERKESLQEKALGCGRKLYG